MGAYVMTTDEEAVEAPAEAHNSARDLPRRCSPPRWLASRINTISFDTEALA